jgi:ribonuclease HII
MPHFQEEEALQNSQQTKNKPDYTSKLEQNEQLLFSEESPLNNENSNVAKYNFIAGGDEAGRGCLAGPVVSALVVLDPQNYDDRIDDSKKLSAKLRRELYQKIINHSLAYEIAWCSHQEIDHYNILEATKKAFNKAYLKITKKPDFILFDALTVKEIPVPQKKIIHGDAISFSIAAASILAKHYRDQMMETFDQQYPGYDFVNNKGYGTATHLAAIDKLGPCPIHRMTFRPLKQDNDDQLHFDLTLN